MKTLGRYLNATTFYAAAAVGIVIAASLYFYEVNQGEDIEFSEPIAQRSEGVSTVQVRATNQTDKTLCPEIRIAARDPDGEDLESVVAEPVDDDGVFSPRESIRFQAVLAGITDQEFDEEFDEYAAFVWEMHRCV